MIELIGVPFDGYGRPGNQSRAAVALREAGLLAGAFGDREVVDGGDVMLSAPDPTRGRDTSLVNEPALLAMTAAVGDRVAAAVPAGRLPIVFGSDCSVLLGVTAALPEPALVFVDGHEDTMPLDVSEDGEAANTEIGILLGVTGGLLRGPLARRRGILPRDRLAVLGPRDEQWRRRFAVGSVGDGGVWLRDLAAVTADPGGVARELADRVARWGGGWWLHTDLDVFDPVEFAAQDLPGVADEPGGLTWTQLTELLTAALRAGGAWAGAWSSTTPTRTPTASTRATSSNWCAPSPLPSPARRVRPVGRPRSAGTWRGARRWRSSSRSWS